MFYVAEGMEPYLNNSTEITYVDRIKLIEPYSVRLYYRLEDNTERLPHTLISDLTE